MDTQSENIIEQLLKRLDKIENQQHKMDRVMELLDTLQNILERQNQKQNLLDEILVKMAIKPEQDKVITTEQLQGAQHESMESFCVLDSKDFTLFPHTPTQPFQGRVNQTDDRLKSIDDRTVDTAQKCRQLISWSQKIEGKLTDNNRENMKTFLAEIRSVKDLIKGQTNSELIWLNNQIDRKLSDIDSVVREIYQQQTEAKEEIVCSAGQVGKTIIHHDKRQGGAAESLGDKKSPTEISDKQMQTILNLERSIQQLNSSVCDVPREMKTSLDTITATNKQFIIDLENTIRNSMVEMNEKSKEQSLSINETVKSDLNKLLETVQSELETNNKLFISESETQHCRIQTAAKSAIEDMKHLIQTEGGNTTKYKVELENIHTLINDLAFSICGNTVTVVKKIDSLKASMASRHITVNKSLDKLPSILKDYINETNREILAVTKKEAQIGTSDLKDYIYKTKRDIFAVTEKEIQIARDQMQGSLMSQGKYTFDFYINNFKTLVRSGKEVDSLPWHINEMRTCVTGNVTMRVNGEMDVWLLHGRHPREVGLQPRSSKTLEIKATICDMYVKKLPPVNVGVRIGWFGETAVVSNGDCGLKIGVTSCDELLQKGYGEKEDYSRGASLIRYEISVL